ncbi:FolB domain protein [Gregarina niphandrodes]|uniref:dihydroneopterin aldolase n=1 Tax=Gregarina niphandrodes TaxID=110365 RepID=A0A023AZ99_GRENI|nr:FolB domain protein [Gregarina niphandrodes]EZG43954.1 FolB domain protein [Gregarina niphandrodes]|eukprot:XP_011132885.1 FolB domain protein [Gregarina niphandrodes]
MICKVEVGNLECFGCHGVKDREKEQEQPFLVSLECTMSAWSDGDDYVCYSNLCDMVRSYVKTQKKNLLEELATDLAVLIFSMSPSSIDTCTVSIRKPTVEKNKRADLIQVSQTLGAEEYENLTRPDVWLWKREYMASPKTPRN